MNDSEAFGPTSIAADIASAHYVVADGKSLHRGPDLEHDTGEFPPQDNPTASFRAAQASYQGLAGVYPNRSEEHTSELQSLMRISYAVFCLNKKNIRKQQ